MSLSLILCGDDELQGELALILTAALHEVDVVPPIHAEAHQFYNADVLIFLCTQENQYRIGAICTELRTHPEFEHIPFVAFVLSPIEELKALFLTTPFELIFDQQTFTETHDFCRLITAVYRKMRNLQRLYEQQQYFAFDLQEEATPVFNGQFHILAKKDLSHKIFESLPENATTYTYTEPSVLQTQLDRLSKSVVIIDLSMGDEAMKLVSSMHLRYKGSAVMVIIPEQLSDTYLEKCLEIGITDIMIYPKPWPLFNQHIDHLMGWKALYHHYQQNIYQQLSTSFNDGLTSLYNRRYLDRLLAYRLKKLDSIAIMMLDIDLFKQVNDQYGHLMGDEVLKIVSQIIQQHFRMNDTVGRWGGEEFVVIIDHRDTETTLELAERLRRTVSEKEFRIAHNDHHYDISLSVSIGVAISDKKDVPVSLIERADKALYLAKNNGRNRAEFVEN